MKSKLVCGGQFVVLSLTSEEEGCERVVSRLSEGDTGYASRCVPSREMDAYQERRKERMELLSGLHFSRGRFHVASSWHRVRQGVLCSCGAQEEEDNKAEKARRDRLAYYASQEPDHRQGCAVLDPDNWEVFTFSGDQPKWEDTELPVDL